MAYTITWLPLGDITCIYKPGTFFLLADHGGIPVSVIAMSYDLHVHKSRDKWGVWLNRLICSLGHLIWGQSLSCSVSAS